MRDGLQLKLLLYPVRLLFEPSAVLQSPSLFVSRFVPNGNCPSWAMLEFASVSVAPPKICDPAFLGKRTPLPTTVIAAPSYAPSRVGSCNCSARLPFSEASQPMIPS